jgi:isoleucyl-tRNA synthetase
MRKKAGFEVMDNIRVYISGNEKLAGVFEANRESICRDVLAADVVYGEGGFAKELDINGESVTFGVEKI